MSIAWPAPLYLRHLRDVPPKNKTRLKANTFSQKTIMSAQTPKLGVFNGLICIRKPIHVSSGDVVAAVKSKVTKFIIESLPPSQRPKSRKQEHKLVKVGHGGTLDPLATGCLGKFADPDMIVYAGLCSFDGC